MALGSPTPPFPWYLRSGGGASSLMPSAHTGTHAATPGGGRHLDQASRVGHARCRRGVPRPRLCESFASGGPLWDFPPVLGTRPSCGPSNSLSRAVGRSVGGSATFRAPVLFPALSGGGVSSLGSAWPRGQGLSVGPRRLLHVFQGFLPLSLPLPPPAGGEPHVLNSSVLCNRSVSLNWNLGFLNLNRGVGETPSLCLLCPRGAAWGMAWCFHGEKG